MKGAIRDRVLSGMTFLVLAWSGLACSSSAVAPPDEDPDPNGNPPPGAPAVYTATVHAMSGVETHMRAVVWVGARAVTRAEAGNASALRSAGFHDSNVETDGEGGNRTRQISAQKGQTVTIIAIESEGVHNGNHLLESLAPLRNVLEFVSFTGATVMQPEPAVATFVAGDANVSVTVNYRRMPQILFRVTGATGVRYSYALPPIREIPERQNPYAQPFNAPSVIFAPDGRIYGTLQFRSGSTVTLTAMPNGEFLRWSGACAGQGVSCTLTFGGQVGTQDQTTSLFTGYLACELGGPTVYSGYAPGAPLDPRCAVIHP